MNRQNKPWSGFCLLAVTLAYLTGCGTTVNRTGDRPKPVWYHAADPAPDTGFIYFTGYSEACFNFAQARNLAEQNARQRVAAYLGTQIMDELEQVTAKTGSDWAGSAAPGGVLSRIFGPDFQSPSSKTADQMRNEVTSYVNELVRRARVKDLYVETVTVKEGFSSYQRYDAGVLLEFPREEIERIDRQDQMEQQKAAGLSRVVRQAESMWSMGKKADAMSLLQAESRKDPMNSELIVRLAQFQEEAGQTDAALKTYMKAAEQEPAGSDWGKLARSRITALSNVRLAGFLQLASKYEGLAGGGLSDGLGWMQKGQVSRARKMFREKYEADPAAQADLLAWYLTALRESQGGSMAAEYDLSVSRNAVSQQIRQYQTGQQALPAVITLLTFIQQDVETAAAIEALWQIRQTIGSVEFPPEIGNMALMALNESSNSKARKLSQWLNNQE
jgi:tetratricopeptide (TPR) repeat protein